MLCNDATESLISLISCLRSPFVWFIRAAQVLFLVILTSSCSVPRVFSWSLLAARRRAAIYVSGLMVWLRFAVGDLVEDRRVRLALCRKCLIPLLLSSTSSIRRGASLGSFGAGASVRIGRACADVKDRGEAQRSPTIEHDRCSVWVSIIVGMHHVVGPRAGERQAASTSQVGQINQL